MSDDEVVYEQDPSESIVTQEDLTSSMNNMLTIARETAASTKTRNHAKNAAKNIHQIIVEAQKADIAALEI